MKIINNFLDYLNAVVSGERHPQLTIAIIWFVIGLLIGINQLSSRHNNSDTPLS